MSTSSSAESVVALRNVRVDRGDRTVLSAVDWSVETSDRWVVLGANGSGKSTLLQVAALRLHPMTGTVEVFGETLGRTDVRVLRRRIGYAAAALADQLRPALTALEVVMTAKHAALEPWWHHYDDDDRGEALNRMHRLGVGHLADHQMWSLSSGEKQRVLIARTLMGEVAAILLDEPNAGLDLAGREELVGWLDRLEDMPLVLVTHHLEEVPVTATHALLLRSGKVVASGPVDEVLNADHLGETFGLSVDVQRDRRGRWSATATDV